MPKTQETATATSILEHAIQTISIEAEALTGLIPQLNSAFINCVEHILSLAHNETARVVLTGIGKSAIIAQKITATFNSTGTPALFMHAADAIHGDLGMIQKQDLVICLSKSGETPEIKVLIPLLKRLGNQLAAIVGNANSYLAQQADYPILCAVSQEACPNNLAPTSSTTAQLAIGDALAVCVIRAKGFSSSDFAKFHPGGSLGKQLYLHLSDIYKKNKAPAILPTAGIREVIMAISAGLSGATAVINEQQQIQGIITDGDLRRAFQKNNDLSHFTAQDLMTEHPKTLPENTSAAATLHLLQSKKLNQILVTATTDGRYVGIVHLHDLLREGLA